MSGASLPASSLTSGVRSTVPAMRARASSMSPSSIGLTGSSMIASPPSDRNSHRFRSLRQANNNNGGESMLGTILIILVILLLIGALPRWGYSSGWGYGPSGLLGLILIIVVVLLLLNRL